MMRVLALDVGDKHIGVAISDPTQSLARSLGVIEHVSPRQDFAAVVRLVEQYEVETVVVGYPRSLDGTTGLQAQKVEQFVAGLTEVLSSAKDHVPVLLWDERLSTVSADRLMSEAGLKGKKKRERLDAAAAAVILQDYLDSELQNPKLKAQSPKFEK